MKELEYLDVINKTLGDSSLLGDDCAYLRELNLFITQDTLVEGIHFDMDTTTAYELGQKALNVNLSDLAASLSKPLYVTISLSLPENINSDFVEQFYSGVEKICKEYDVKVAGGDLTGSDKVVISVCAIGKKVFDIDVSRHFSKPDDVIVTTGTSGDSAGGLKLLLQGKKDSCSFIKKHLLPEPGLKVAFELGTFLEKENIKELSVMDTSDGLGDAIYKLSKGCGFQFDIDYDRIPVSKELATTFPSDYKNLALWGGEDFELLFTIPEFVYEKLDKNKFFKIGKVTNKPFSKNSSICIEYEKNIFKHFEE